MISFDSFRLEDGIPIYLQIILYLKRGMVSGRIVNGDILPSRRNLSALLGVNPNTVQKAYHLLEETGLILSQSGAKSQVVLDENTLASIRKELLENDIVNVVEALKQAGLSKQGAMELLELYWQ